MSKSIAFKTTAVTLGLATVITLGAVTPSLAKGDKGSASFSVSSNSAVASTPLAFSLTNIPAIYTDAKSIAKQLVIKVVELPADATVAPATPPATTGKSKSKEKGKGDGIKVGDDNTTLLLTGTTLTGQINLRGPKTAGIQNYAIYPMVAADSRTGLAAQAGTPVFVTATTAADGTVSLSNQSGAVTVDLALNTGTILAPQTATVNVPADGKTYQLVVTQTSGDDKHSWTVALTGTGAVTVNLPLLKAGTYSVDLIQVAATNSFTIGTDGVITAPLTIG